MPKRVGTYKQPQKLYAYLKRSIIKLKRKGKTKMTKTQKDQSEYSGLLDLMSDHIIRSGIHEGWLEGVKDKLIDSPNKPINDFIGLAVKLMYDMEWKEVHDIWTLPGLTPQVWERYEQFDMEDVRELVMLNDALTALYNRFRTIMKM